MRTEKELQELYKDAMEFWGFRKQARMVQEECAELILATSHHLRKRAKGEEEMIEELGDVYLMTQQMMAYFGPERIMEIVDYKSERTKAKLERYKKMREKKRNGN